jgi:hypothetical protein
MNRARRDWTMPRRCLVMAALLFWQGGATFYAAIVIPTGLTTLHPSALQTFVTQRVTSLLNLTAFPVLVLFAWDTLFTGDPSPARRKGRWISLVLVLLSLPMLVWLHARIDAHMDQKTLHILARDTLRPFHRAYLWVSGLQWVAATGFAFLTLASWRGEDLFSRRGAGNETKVHSGSMWH